MARVNKMKGYSQDLQVERESTAGANSWRRKEARENYEQALKYEQARNTYADTSGDYMSSTKSKAARGGTTGYRKTIEQLHKETDALRATHLEKRKKKGHDK